MAGPRAQIAAACVRWVGARQWHSAIHRGAPGTLQVPPNRNWREPASTCPRDVGGAQHV